MKKMLFVVLAVWMAVSFFIPRICELDGSEFKNLGGTVSGDILSTDVAGGFTGSLIGLYATSANDIQL